MPKWILFLKWSEMTGVTKDTFQWNKRNGIWLEGVHWVKRNSRLYVNWQEMDKWVETDQAYLCGAAASKLSSSSRGNAAANP